MYSRDLVTFDVADAISQCVVSPAWLFCGFAHRQRTVTRRGTRASRRLKHAGPVMMSMINHAPERLRSALLVDTGVRCRVSRCQDSKLAR